MFQKKDGDLEQALAQTTLGSSILIEGTFVAEEDVQLWGKVKGDMKIHGILHIQDGAEVYGDIEAHSVFIDGFVEGGCRVSEDVHIMSHGTLKGDAHVGNQLIIQPGATFLGSSTMVEKADVEVLDDDTLADDDIDLDLDEI